MGTLYYGSSYGYRSSVNNFNPCPELLVAFGRRFFRLMVDHYVDDFPILDFPRGYSANQAGLFDTFTSSGARHSKKEGSTWTDHRDVPGPAQRLHDYDGDSGHVP